MKRPAKNKINRSLLGAIGAAMLGLAAGAAAVFFAKKENRDQVKRTVDNTVKRTKMEVVKAKKKVLAAKKKILKK